MVEDGIVHIVKARNTQYYSTVHIYAGTLGHIIRDHPEEASRLVDVCKTIEAPCRIYQSKTDPERSLALINDKVTSTGGDPLRVIVKIVSDSEAIMKTAHFCSSNNHGTLLWEDTKDENRGN